MSLPLRWVPGIPDAVVSGLAARDIADTEALLSRARLPEQRRSLASDLGVDVAVLEPWVSVADLVRISSLTPASAVLIATSGVARSVQELADALGPPGEAASSRPVVQVEPVVRPGVEQVLRRLEEHAEARAALRKVPLASDLEQAADEARQLVPRMIAGPDTASATATRELEALQRIALRHSIRTSVGLVLWLVGLAALGLGILRFLMRRQVVAGFDDILAGRITPSEADALEGFRVLTLEVVDVSMGALAGLLTSVLLILVLLLALHELVSHAWRWFAWRTVLRDDDARRAYLGVMRVEAERVGHMGRVAWLVVVAASVVGVVTLFWNDVATWTDLSGEQLLLISAALLVSIGVVAIFVPITRQLARRARDGGPESPRIVRALSANTTVRLVIEVAFLMGVIHFLPMVVSVASSVISDVAVTRIERTTDRAAADLEALVAAMDSDDADRDGRELVTDFTDRLVSLGTLLDAGLERLPELLTTFARYLTPSLLLAALFAVVLPFLILGGWLRGAFFMVLLAAVSWTEVGAQRYVTSTLGRWFSSDDSTWLVPALVSLAVFSNAIVFEWIYELLLERRRGCVACRADVEAGAAFCPSCGMPQE